MKKLVLCILYTTCCFIGVSQSRFRFFTLGPDEGLSNPFVWSICQDKNGFMWLGTVNGLNRYDGHTIKKYLHNPEDSFSIPTNTVLWIYKDGDGDMWFACGVNGVVKYNYEKDRFEKFPLYDSLRKKVNLPAPVWRIGEDGRGNMYLACGGACFRYDKRTNKIEDLTPLFKGAIDAYGVAMFIPQGKDSLWILTDIGLFFHDIRRNIIEEIPFDADIYGYGLASMLDGEFINKHDILISTPRAGFVLFDTRTRTFSHAPAPFDPGTARRYSETGGVLKDSRGRVWLVNSLYGLVEYNPDTRAFYSMKQEPSYPYPHPEQEGKGMNLYEDRDGNIWYGTSRRGLIWFQPGFDFIEIYQRDYAAKNSLPDNVVSTFAERANKMLIGTGRGITSFDKAKNSFFNYPYALDHVGSYPYGVTRLFNKRNDDILISTAWGFNILNQANKFQRFIKDENRPNSLLENNTWFIEPTGPDELLISGARSLIRFNTLTNSYDTTPGDPLNTFRDVNAFLRQGNKIWLESGKGELYEYDISRRTAIRHHYSKDSIPMIITMKSRGDDIILGLQKGFIIYNPISKRSTRFALPSVSQQVHNLEVQGNILWIATPTDIIKYDIVRNKAIAFNLTVLLPNSYISDRSMYIDKSGMLWIGTNQGFGVIDTARFRSGNVLAAPRIVNFYVFDKQKTFDQAFEDLERIRLNYDENFFSIYFSAFNFGQTAGVQYFYRLDGFDKDWKQSENNSASYTNVPPGTYTLLLKVRSAQGQEIEGKPVVISIRPPFWKSWWFITIVALLFLLVVFWVMRQVRNRRQDKAMEKTIDYFANSVYGENSVDEICWDIARNCISELGFEDCVVYLKEENSNTMVQRAAFGPKNPKGHDIVNPMEIAPGKGIVGTVAQTGKPLLVPDTSKDDRYIIDDMSRASELAVPILHDGIVIGVIDSEHSQKNFFTQKHMKAVSLIASISSNKIAEAQAEAHAKSNEIKLLEIQKLLAESQLMALRAQMNPHFVFNCLNSIQECIVTEKYGEASKYLNKFSKLFRMVLNNSGKNLVSLSEEKEVLELYLELEQMRFEKSFSYSIVTDEDLESDDMLIPSMLLQPYVENALWHGLMHKQGDRNLLIEFRRLNEDVFTCIIEDNGIGRKQSYALKEQQSKTKRHESKGLKITSDRLEVLRRQGYHATIDIIDKETGGTRVVIELSTWFKN